MSENNKKPVQTEGAPKGSPVQVETMQAEKAARLAEADGIRAAADMAHSEQYPVRVRALGTVRDRGFTFGLGAEWQTTEAKARELIAERLADPA
jgi:hypothetical protein